MIEQSLGECPSREALLAWLWSRHVAPPGHRRAIDAAKRSRLREVAAFLRGEGIASVYLWGAGDHSRWVVEHERDLALALRGIVDDNAGLEGRMRFGHQVSAPGALRPGDAVLISSDWHEDAIWEASAPHRRRGVRVFRLYGEG